jgi:5-methylcytosine-specific restriction enzyme subunit McrC
MNNPQPKIIELTEYSPELLPRSEIPDEAGEALWRDYSTQVAVDFPSPKTSGQWQLTAQGWVGHIPLTPELGVSLSPKVELGNLFRMLEYAYRLKSFRFLDGLIECKSLEDFYERLANILARRILDRGRKGFYREYIPETERLPYIRGRMDLQQAMNRPWDVTVRCHYEEHTPDIEENQILVWTLSRIARSGMCTERVLPTVRRAYRSLLGLTKPIPHSPQACAGRFYNRLNDDYQPMHALCRFFLEQSGPSHETGDRTMLPFLVDMARLYELFVAEWLKVHLPKNLMLKAQERVNIGPGKTIRFDIDLVLYDVDTGAAQYVLDTKYKTSPTPLPDDVAQIVAYSEAKDCHEAILVYPTPLTESLDEWVGDNRVRSLTFSLDGDLDEAGQIFIDRLLQNGENSAVVGPS